MSTQHRSRRWILPACIMLSVVSLRAQTTHESSVLAAGSVAASDEEIALLGTIGQPIAGHCAESGTDVHLGFWIPRDSRVAANSLPEPIASTFGITCSPNPAIGRTTIRLNAPPEQPLSLSLHDMLGREVRTLFAGLRTDGSLTFDFDTGQLPSGHYTLVLTSEHNRTLLPVHILR